MTAHLTGIFVTHNPIGSPGHHMGLTLRDYPQTARTGVIFDRTPGRHLADVPGAVKGFFMMIVSIKCDTVEVRRRRWARLSAAFRMLFSTAVFLPSHATIVTYSLVAVRQL